MSFREKHLWISIIAALGVWGFYFWHLFTRVADGGLTDSGFAPAVSGLFVGSLVLVVVIEVVLSLLATASTPRAERNTRDERELLASLKASHVALMFLLGLVSTVAMAVYFTGWIGGEGLARIRTTATDVNIVILLANILVASGVLTEIVRAGLTLALLRKLR